MFFGLGQILGPPGGPPRDPDAPHALRSSNSLVILSGPLGGVPGGRQGPVGRPLGGPKFDPDQKTSLGTSRDHLGSF